MRFLLIIFILVMAISVSSCQNIKHASKIISAEMAYNARNYKKTIKIYEELVEADPSNFQYYYKLGIANFSNGERLKVRKYALKLRSLGKDKLADHLDSLVEK